MILKFPGKEHILIWANVLLELESLARYLPAFNEEWAKILESDFRLCQMHPDSSSISRSAARLFYRITKNHHFIDGNKRSAIVCTYLLFIHNSYMLQMSWRGLYHLAKLVAKDKANQENVIDRVAKMFEEDLELIK